MKLRNLSSLPVRTAAAIIALALLAADVQATPVTFVFTGTGSGALDGVPFTNRVFVVAITGDTDDIDNSDPDVRFIEFLAGTIEIDGLAVCAFAEPLYVFSCQSCVALGFGNDVQFDLINVEEQGVGIETYDLTTSFGPVFTETPYFGQFENVVTNAGLLTFTAMSNVTFLAEVGTPEFDPAVEVRGHGTLFEENPDGVVLDQVSIHTWFDTQGNVHGRATWTSVYHGLFGTGPGSSGYPWHMDVTDLLIIGNVAYVQAVVTNSPQYPEDEGTEVLFVVVDNGPDAPDQLSIYGGPLLNLDAGDFTVR